MFTKLTGKIRYKLATKDTQLQWGRIYCSVLEIKRLSKIIRPPLFVSYPDNLKLLDD